jgi:hypothetical protein
MNFEELIYQSAHRASCLDHRSLDRLVAIQVVITGALLLVGPKYTVVLADSLHDGVFAINSAPYGLTYEEWTIKFWQWLMPIPTDKSPVTDKTGENCRENQGELPVFFLAFAGGGAAERTCNIASGKAILIPVNVVECSFLELPSAKTEEELHVCAEEDESSNPGVYLSVDNREFKDLLKYRVHSNAFNVTFSDLFGTGGGPTRAVSDGYWIILEPLPPGKHEIHFKAILTNPQTGVLVYSDDLLYHVNVAEEIPSSIRLNGTSTGGKFQVEVNWTSADIGSENTFFIKMRDAGGQELKGATYDVMLLKGDQLLAKTRSNQTAMEQKYSFDAVGSYTLKIENINGSGENENINIPIQVTPEFPISISTVFSMVFTAILFLLPIASKRLFSDAK